MLKKKENSQAAAVQIQQPSETKKLPRLVDLGADKCVPCKMMAPILEEIKKDYAGVINVEFIDVWKEPDKAKEYGVSIIPTQIFYDAAGKELFRHEGFYSKEDILGKWKELGVELTKIK
ncbi:MAG: thioredoxin family protein [Sedimentisphaerales bacterium]|nr:thioredoxin family protein [Sedimentisphaerales bacterium]